MNEGDSLRRPVSKGHLNPQDTPITRYPPAADLADQVRHHWVPEWRLPEGVTVTARVLGYPALNLVVDPTGVLVSGATRAESRRVLRGGGWAVGVLLQPAATLALGYDATALLDTVAPLDEPGLRDDVVAAMTSDADKEQRHRAGIALVQAWLRDRLAPVADAGRLANAAVALVEEDPSVHRVDELAARLHVSARTLQRAVRRCTGMSPHAVIRRRRLHDAAERLRTGAGEDLARVAAEAGYADHAHLSREFRAATQETPKDYRDHHDGRMMRQ